MNPHPKILHPQHLRCTIKMLRFCLFWMQVSKRRNHPSFLVTDSFVHGATKSSLSIPPQNGKRSLCNSQIWGGARSQAWSKENLRDRGCKVSWFRGLASHPQRYHDLSIESFKPTQELYLLQYPETQQNCPCSISHQNRGMGKKKLCSCRTQDQSRQAAMPCIQNICPAWIEGRRLAYDGSSEIPIFLKIYGMSFSLIRILP